MEKSKSRITPSLVYEELKQCMNPKYVSVLEPVYKKVLENKIPSDPVVNFQDIQGSIPYHTGTTIINALPYSVHNGQRKLFLNKVQFLTDHLANLQENAIIIYAGAAPSNPARHFLELSPNVSWLLVDPNPFYIFEHDPVRLIGRKIDADGKFDKHGPGICNTISEAVQWFVDHYQEKQNRICIISDYFTIDLAKEISKRIVKKVGKVFFFSDIRTRLKNTDLHPSDFDLIWNLAQQYNWVKTINPTASMLKWRLPFHILGSGENVKDFLKKPGPWHEDFRIAKEEFGCDFLKYYQEGTTYFLEGEIKLQPWAPIHSTETRLVIKQGAKLTNFGTITNYENAFKFQNHVCRLFGYFKNSNASEKLGFDHCADCSLENQIWENYGRKLGSSEKKSFSVKHWVMQICKTLHRSLFKNLHGHRFNGPPSPVEMHSHLKWFLAEGHNKPEAPVQIE
jgi:hypothetical protein